MSTGRVGALRRLKAAAWRPYGLTSAIKPRSLAVRKNISNRCRKLLNAGTRHDDAITATVSFLGDTQEPAALIFSELDIKMLALNLQFFRFDDVIHFALRPRVRGCRAANGRKIGRI